MKAEELRIGNLVYWNIPEKLNVLHEVVGIFQNRLQTQPISLGNSMEEYLPIPLTDEWLERFGFEENGKAMGDRVWSKVVKWNDPDGELRVHPTFDLDYFNSSMFIWFNNLMNRRIDTVHELQNLFYSITGTELELKQ